MTGMLELWLGRILKVLALMLILAGCGQQPPPPVVPVALQVSPAALLLEPGGKSQVLSAAAYGADDSKLEITDIEWLNSDPAQV